MSSVAEGAKNFGWTVLGVALLAAGLGLFILMIAGGVWVGEKVLPWLIMLSGIAIVACIVLLGPLALFRTTRPWAAIDFYSASYLFGLIGWFMELLLTWSLWAGFALPSSWEKARKENICSIVAGCSTTGNCQFR